MNGQGQRTSRRQEVKNAACTWLASEVTPNLTRERDTLDAVEEMEDTLSWLPLRSLEFRRLVDMRGREWGEGVDVAEPPAFAILCTGANRPCSGLQSKYLQKKAKKNKNTILQQEITWDEIMMITWQKQHSWTMYIEVLTLCLQHVHKAGWSFLPQTHTKKQCRKCNST